MEAVEVKWNEMMKKKIRKIKLLIRFVAVVLWGTKFWWGMQKAHTKSNEYSWNVETIFSAISLLIYDKKKLFSF